LIFGFGFSNFTILNFKFSNLKLLFVFSIFGLASRKTTNLNPHTHTNAPSTFHFEFSIFRC